MNKAFSTADLTKLFDSSSYQIDGTASLDKAEIVFVVDVPFDPLTRKHNIQVINAIRDEHLILVENIPQINKKMPAENPLIQGILSIKNVSGWDSIAYIYYKENLESKMRDVLDLEAKVLEDIRAKKFGALLVKTVHLFL